MPKTITREQLEEIEDAIGCFDKGAAHALLKKYTGIEARPYTAYQFYDEAGNYVGDSENDDFEEIIRSAYIKII